MITYFFMALPTMVLVELKNKLNTLDKIKRMQRTMFYINVLYIALLLVKPFNFGAYVAYLVVIFVLKGLQKEVFLEAKDKFLEFVEENKNDFTFIPLKIEGEYAVGLLALPNGSFFCEAKCFLLDEMGIHKKDADVLIYISVDYRGELEDVFCML